MRSQLESIFHDVTNPVPCVSYLLEKNHLSEDTAQLIVAQESDLESWDILLTSLESLGGSLESFKEALSFAEQGSILERIEEELHRQSSEDQPTYLASRPASESDLFPVPPDRQPFAGEV